tara:strand:- start:37812 stop:38240 length:429 start_codon:yes stop_codon:yes gene_type:complete
MYIILTGCAQQGASPPFAASLDVSSLQDIADMSAVGTGSIVTFTTPIGVLDATVVPSGGSGNYTFSWAVTKTFENSDTGSRFSVASTGSTNGPTYNSLTINGARPAGGGQVFDAEFNMACTASDGVTNIVVNVPIRVIAAGF